MIFWKLCNSLILASSIKAYHLSLFPECSWELSECSINNFGHQQAWQHDCICQSDNQELIFYGLLRKKKELFLICSNYQMLSLSIAF